LETLIYREVHWIDEDHDGDLRCARQRPLLKAGTANTNKRTLTVVAISVLAADYR
jgi:hypothetical protein